MPLLSEKKVLLFHPFLRFYGGAEYVFSVIANELFPQADILTIASNHKVLEFAGIKPTRVQTLLKSELVASRYKELALFYPALVDTIQKNGYDIVVSCSYAYTHGIITLPDQCHISYIHTPMRALWLKDQPYWPEKIPVISDIYHRVLAEQRVWDRAAAMRPDYMISVSKEVQLRVQRFWGRVSEVISPPVDVDFYRPADSIVKEDYFVTHARLVAHKRIDLLIELCKKNGKRLVIIGDGSATKMLKQQALANNNIEFVGFVPLERKRELLQKAKGYLFAAYEDFGVGVVEAMASGTPVLAYGKGGATETVVAGTTGEFFTQQSQVSLEQAFDQFEKNIASGKYTQEALLARAGQFSKKIFVQKFGDYIEQKLAEYEFQGPPISG